MDDGLFAPIPVSAYQLAAALHDPCPLRGCAKSGQPWGRCRRAVRLVEAARSLLERAAAEPVLPPVPEKAQVAEPPVSELWQEGTLATKIREALDSSSPYCETHGVKHYLVPCFSYDYVMGKYGGQEKT